MPSIKTRARLHHGALTAATLLSLQLACSPAAPAPETTEDTLATTRTVTQAASALRPDWANLTARPLELDPGSSNMGRSIAIYHDIDGVEPTLMATGGTGTVEVFEYNPMMKSWQRIANIYYPEAHKKEFGASVAIEGDTLVVGAPQGGVGGEVKVFSRDEGGVNNWGEVATIEPTFMTRAPADRFGEAIALDGDRLVVGAPKATDTVPIEGLAQVFERQPDGSWAPGAILSGDAPEEEDNFGTSVAIYGGLIAVGAPGIKDPNNSVGGVFTFTDDNNGAWQNEGITVATVGFDGDRFGEAIALDDASLLVGAPGYDSSGAIEDSGMVYAFDRIAGGWINARKIVQPNPVADLGYGTAIALDRDRAIIGADGAGTTDRVYSATHDSTASPVWALEVLVEKTNSYSNYGEAVALAGNLAAVGLPSSQFGENGVGGVEAYSREPLNPWIPDGIPTPKKRANGARAGSQVGFSHHSIVMLADRGSSTSGDLHFYWKDQNGEGEWGLSVVDTNLGSLRFGTSLAMDEGLLAIGAPDAGTSGIVQLHQPHDPRSRLKGWSQLNAPAPSYATQGFGFSVDVDAPYAVAGNENASNNVRVYFKPQNGPPIATDIPIPDGNPNMETGFGRRVAISMPYLAVNSGYDDRVYIYRHDDAASAWSHTQTITHPSGVPMNEEFGRDVELGDGVLLITSMKGSMSGTVHTYALESAAPDADWIEQPGERLDGAPGSEFGANMHLRGDILAIGAAGEGSGRVYLYERVADTTSWTPLDVLESPSQDGDERFGESFAVSDTGIVVGAPLDDTYAPDGGRVTLFLAGSGCIDDASCSTGYLCNALPTPSICVPIDACGNGVIEGAEGCDDGNAEDGDGCDANCMIELDAPCQSDTQCAEGTCHGGPVKVCSTEPLCGNGALDPGEGCDRSVMGSVEMCNSCKLADSAPCATDESCQSGICVDSVCVRANQCGNGVVEEDNGEECDDGNRENGDMCDSRCKIEVPEVDPPTADLEVSNPAPMKDNLFEQLTITFEGTAHEDARVTIQIDGNLTPSVEREGELFRSKVKLEEGPHIVHIVATLGSDEDNAIIPFEIKLAPVTVNGVNASSDDVNTFEAGDTITGKAKSGQEITVELDGSVICQTTADDDGNWQCVLEESGEGELVVKDMEGNVLGEFNVLITEGRDEGDLTRDNGRGCAAAPSGSPGSPLLLLLGLLVVGFRRREAMVRGAVAIALILTTGAACSPVERDSQTPASEPTTRTQALFEYRVDWQGPTNAAGATPRSGYESLGQAVTWGDDIVAVAADGQVVVYNGDLPPTRLAVLEYEGSLEDEFGASLDYHDGLLVIGAPNYKDKDTRRGGAVFVYRYAPNDDKAPVFDAIITNSRGDDLDVRFGAAVATHDEYIAIGAPHMEQSGIQRVGATYMYKFGIPDNGIEMTPIWHNVWRHIRSSPMEGMERGSAIDMNAEMLVIGAPAPSTTRAGEAYALRKDPNADHWQFAGDLVPDVTQAKARFGASVALVQDRIIVGSPRYDLSAPQLEDSGMVYSFTEVAAEQWDEVKFLPPDLDEQEQYGTSLASSGSYLFVGAPGTKRASDMQRTGGVHTIQLMGGVNYNHLNVYTHSASVAGERFGTSVSAHNSRFIAGSPLRSGSFANSGAAYAFQSLQLGVWLENEVIENSSALDQQRVGYSVAIDNDFMAVGAPGNGVDTPGSVYLYERLPADRGNGWELVQHIVSASNNGDNLFGDLVALDQDTLVVREKNDVQSPRHESNVHVYVRDDDTGQWEFVLKEAVREAGEGNRATFDIEGDMIIVGSTEVGALVRIDRRNGNWTRGTSTTISVANRHKKLGDSVAIFDGVIATPALDEGEGIAYVFFFEPNDGDNLVSTSQIMTPFTQGSFGSAIAFDGSLIAVRSLDSSGAARILTSYKTSIGANDSWEPLTELPTDLLPPEPNLGDVLVLERSNLLVSSPGANNDEGLVHILERDPNTPESWIKTLDVSSGSAARAFGTGFDYQNGELAVGAPLANVNAPAGGASVVFSIGISCDTQGPCSPGFSCLGEQDEPKRCVPDQRCGNGIRDNGEACDDGNLLDYDSCTNNCRLPEGQPCQTDAFCESSICVDMICQPEGVCGNGRVEEAFGEACDDGIMNGAECPLDCKLLVDDPCTQDMFCSSGVCEDMVCQVANICGNKRVDEELGEECDLGNPDGDETCALGCKLPKETPELTVTSPRDGDRFEQLTIGISGEIHQDASLNITVDGEPVDVKREAADGELESFNARVELTPGTHEIKAVAELDGELEMDTRTIEVEQGNVQVNGTSLDSNGINTFNVGDIISGTAAPGTTIIIELDGVQVCQTTADSFGNWQCALTKEGTGTLVIKDGEGNVLGKFNVEIVSNTKEGDLTRKNSRGCAAAPSDSPGSPLLLLLGLLVAGFRRREAMVRGAMALALIFTLHTSCSPTAPPAHAPEKTTESQTETYSAALETRPDWGWFELVDIYAQDSYKQMGTAIARDGDLIAVGSNGRVTIVDANTNEQLVEIDYVGSDQEQFGAALDLKGDILVVGAPRGPRHRENPDGKIFIYRKTASPALFELEYEGAKFADDNSRYGAAVAISPSGQYIAVGIPGYTNNLLADSGRGQVLTYVSNTSSWEYVDAFSALEEFEGANFGASIAWAGSDIIVGAPGYDGAGDVTKGRVHVIENEGTDWKINRRLLDRSTYFEGFAQGDHLGASVAAAGDRLFVGAPMYDHPGNAYPDAGMVYTLEFDGVEAWEIVGEPNGKLPTSPTSGERYGTSLATSDDYLIIGAPGASSAGELVVFALADIASMNMMPAPELTRISSDKTQSGDRLGEVISTWQNDILIGAPDATRGGSNSGAVFSMIHSGGTTWTSADIFSKSPDQPTSQRFGESVAIDRDTIAVGAPFDGTTRSGSVHVFVRDEDGPADQGEHEATIAIDLSGVAGDRFGAEIALEGDTLVATAPNSPDGSSSAHIYTLTEGENQWVRVAEHIYSRSANARADVAIAENTIAIGAPADQAIQLFRRDLNRNWSTSPAQSLSIENADGFGEHIAMTSKHLVTASTDTNTAALHIFSNDVANSRWELQQTVEFASVTGTFGAALAIDGDLIAVTEEKNAGDNLVHILANGAGDDEMAPWATIAAIQSPVAPSPGFGAALALAGSRLFVSAPNRDVIELFAQDPLDASRWELTRTLSAPNNDLNNSFGAALDYQNGELVVGSPRSNTFGSENGELSFLLAGVNCSADSDCSEGFRCDTTTNTVRCLPIEPCGNGVPDVGELCDDGNEVDGDGCSSSCKREPGGDCIRDSDCESDICVVNECYPKNVCRNGVEEKENNEECDDGNAEDGDGCSYDCKIEVPSMLDFTLASPTEGFTFDTLTVPIIAIASKDATITITIDDEPFEDLTKQGTAWLANPRLTAGDHVISVTATLSPEDTRTETRAITIDIPPVKVGDDDIDPNAINTFNAGEVISGIASSGALVTVELGGVIICAVKADEDGYWECTLPTSGSGELVVRDENGNVLSAFDIEIVPTREDGDLTRDNSRGCQAAPGSAPPASPLLLLLGLLFARARRRHAPARLPGRPLLVGMLALVITLAPMTAAAQEECFLMAYADEAPDKSTLDEDALVCEEMLEDWTEGRHEDGSKNGLYGSNSRPFDTCFFCTTKTPPLRITLPVVDFGQTETRLRMEWLHSMKEPVLITPSVRESERGDEWVFQRPLDLEDLDDGESELIQIEVVCKMPGQNSFGSCQQNNTGQNNGAGEDMGGDMSTDTANDGKAIFLIGYRVSELDLLRPQPRGCQAAPGAPGGGSSWLFALMLAIGFFRRKRAQALNAIATLATASVLLLLPTAASAQDEERMGEEQVKLLNEANQALGQSPADTDTALAKIDEALEKGPRYDILLLTKGRVLQKRDECSEAKKAFGEINVAPHEPSFKRADITRLKERYIGQMSQLCSAQLKIECVDERTEIRLMGTERVCGEVVSLSPGAYQIVASLGKQTKSYDVEVEGAEEKLYTVALEELPEGVDPQGNTIIIEQAQPVDTFHYKRTVASGISTVVLAGAGVGLYIYATNQIDDQEEELEQYLSADGKSYKDAESKAKAAPIETEIDRLGGIQQIGGWGALGVGVVGGLVTTVFAINDSRRARDAREFQERMEKESSAKPKASLLVAPRRGGGSATVLFRF